MTPSENDAQRRPPRLNGPAFLVFGLVFVALAASTRVWWLGVAGGVLAALGAWGIIALRRYERAEGITDVLPGAPPRAEDEGSSDAEASGSEPE